MHSILFSEALDGPTVTPTYEELLKNINLNLERKYGIVSTLGSHVTTVPKDKMDKVKEGIENEKTKKQEEQQEETREEEQSETVKQEEPVRRFTRRATGRKSRVAIAPESIIHRIKNNFGKKKEKTDEKLSFRDGVAKVTNRMKVHVITLPVILRGKVINGINRYSIYKTQKNINKQESEINRLRDVIDKRKKYNEYQQEKIADRNRRKLEKFQNSKYVRREEEREEIERDERLADMDKVNRREEKERIAKAKADFMYALKQQAKEQKQAAKEEKAKEREALKERQRQLKEQQRKEINDMLKELKEQQIRETEKLREELDRLNAVMDENYDKIDELEQEEDEVKGRRAR